ncbi:MAG: hypothetical protein C0409_03960 [Novosphingobium sp.]|nr:hypothetical protein [Novosphingobium sp.]
MRRVGQKGPNHPPGRMPWRVSCQREHQWDRRPLVRRSTEGKGNGDDANALRDLAGTFVRCSMALLGLTKREIGDMSSETDFCGNCGSEITKGGIIKGPNLRIPSDKIEYINAFSEQDVADLCQKCSEKVVRDLKSVLERKIESGNAFVKGHIGHFPIMTMPILPAGVYFKYKGMVTANVSAGTGLFNEFSQGFSDFFGTVSSQSGMAHKVNTGEAVAKSILIQKALALGANCIIAVDIDYGITNNNSATVNMQGTAVKIDNISEIIESHHSEKISELSDMILEISKIKNTLRALSQSEVYGQY